MVVGEQKKSKHKRTNVKVWRIQQRKLDSVAENAYVQFAIT